jgi:oligopeptide/dipeptide ABC transporter ATP-binding protein
MMSQQTLSEPVPLIEARHIKKYFALRSSLLAKVLAGRQDQIVKAVDDVSLKIWPDETVGLVGESGCGKTTLGRVMTRLHEPTAGQLFFRNQPVVADQISVPANGQSQPLRQASQLLFDDSASLSSPPEPMAETEVRYLNFFHLTQIIFQNPYSSLNPRKTVRDIIGVALRQRGIKMRPQFIVADEPVSALDVSIQAQVINLLQELQEEYHLTYLFIAHDLSLIYYLSDRVAVMYLGHVVEEAETGALFDNPLHPYTQALLAAVPVVDRMARRQRIILEGTVPSPIDPPRGCPFHTRCFAKKGPECEHDDPPQVELEGHRVACWLYQ